MYTTDLLCLEFCRRPGAAQLPELQHVTTPLIVQAWASALSCHPDRAFAHYICCGLQFGFRIRFNRSVWLRWASSNMGSACEHPSVVSKYLSKEVALGHMLGPYTRSDHLFSVHVNRFGVIPKGHDTGRWCLITDLSFPWGHSVNDGIDPSLCSLSYSTVDEVADLVARLGAGALLAKVDIESAYRLIPVHPDDSALSWVWNRRVRSLLTQCCCSGFDEPQRFLMRWLTPWLGTCTGPVYHSSGITSMILSLWHLLAPVSAKSCCQSWIMNARLLGFPLQIINAMVLLPA